VRHGERRVTAADLAQLDTDDPYLALVNADMSTWLAAHPCTCDAVCVCLDPVDDGANPLRQGQSLNPGRQGWWDWL
jgi:hypothetical protein